MISIALAYMQLPQTGITVKFTAFYNLKGVVDVEFRSVL